MRLFVTTIFIFLLLPAIVFGKKHRLKTADIIALSDSILKERTGDMLFKYCRLDNGSYYSYKKSDKTRYKLLAGTEKLPKRFVEAHLTYNFQMPYPECPDYDTVTGSITITLQKQDTLLLVARTPDLSFIPEPAKTREKCKVIDSHEALAIAKKDTVKLGVTKPYARLEYDVVSGSFRWIVESLLWNERDFQNDIPAQKDRVLIDAVSGAVIEHKVIPYTDEPLKDQANLE